MGTVTMAKAVLRVGVALLLAVLRLGAVLLLAVLRLGAVFLLMYALYEVLSEIVRVFVGGSLVFLMHSIPGVIFLEWRDWSDNRISDEPPTQLCHRDEPV